MIRLVVADDHPMVRDALATALRQSFAAAEISLAATAGEVTIQLDALTEVDALLVDLDMPGMNGLTGLATWRASHPAVPIIVVSANRDPASGPDPDRLDIGRRPGPHLGFGHGPHQCVGQQLARLELTTVLRTVSRRIPSLRLAVPADQIAFKDDNLVRGPRALPVTWDAVLPATS